MSARNGTSWSGRCEVLTEKELPMGSYAGVDWASDKHDVLVQPTRRARSCWRPRSRTTSRGCGRCAASWCG